MTVAPHPWRISRVAYARAAVVLIALGLRLLTLPPYPDDRDSLFFSRAVESSATPS